MGDEGPAERDVGVIIVAAGRGSRTGSGELKQFRWVAGKPMLLHSIQTFQARPDVAMVVCVLPREHLGDPPPWIFQSDAERLLLSVGGKHRSESVANGLEDLPTECEIVVIHDAAYAALVFEGKPLSFLATPGAKEVGIELHSASKTFNMTGWRCGFVAGNELLVKAYGDVKDNTDSGQFLAIQHAAAHGFDHPEITEQIAAKYSRRMTALVDVLSHAGFKARKPKGSFFLYVRAPSAAIKKDGQRIEFDTAETVSQWLITEKLLSTVPWDDAGAYLRFSVTFVAKDETDERRILHEIHRRLGDVQFVF